MHEGITRSIAYQLLMRGNAVVYCTVEMANDVATLYTELVENGVGLGMLRGRPLRGSPKRPERKPEITVRPLSRHDRRSRKHKK